MRRFLLNSIGLTNVAVALFIADIASAQVVGPARRVAAAAGDAVGDPAVGDRIEQREATRKAVRAETNPNAAARQDARANTAVGADRWRFTRHNNQWWYYTPQNTWMYHHNNVWNAYDRATYTAPRYETGYRGNSNRRMFNRQPQTAAPYSNGSRAGNAGSDLGAAIGGTANAGANEGAGAIGNTVNDINPVAPQLPVRPVTPGPAGPDPVGSKP
jgi:hypothetical protein